MSVEPGSGEFDEPVKRTATPGRFNAAEPFCAKINIEDMQPCPESGAPRIGDLVRVCGRQGAEFVAPIVAIRSVGTHYTYVIAEEPP